MDTPTTTTFQGPIATPSADELADRYAIGQLTKVYALGIDTRDQDLVLSVFAPGATVDGVLGKALVVDYVPRVMSGVVEYAATMHNITNQHIVVDGDDGEVWSDALCLHIEEAGSGRENMTMVVQYRDTAHRFPEGWLIVARATKQRFAIGPFPRLSV